MKTLAMFLGVFLGISLCLPVSAGDRETRVYHVTVDSKPAGEYQAIFATDGSSKLTITSRARVAVKVLFHTYRYETDTVEQWEGQNLLSMHSKIRDDRDVFEITVRKSENGLRVSNRGSEWEVISTAKPTNYWLAPTELGSVALVDFDTGKQRSGVFEKVGTDRFTVQNGEIACDHLRCINTTPTELWYDAQGRLVRLQYVDDGHPTSLSLVRINTN